MLYQFYREHKSKSGVDYMSIGIGTYEQLIDWCSWANEQARKSRAPYVFRMTPLATYEELEAF